MAGGDQVSGVLVVDDEPRISELAAASITFCGRAVTRATTGADTLTSAASTRPGLGCRPP
jgi:CheY-like chemotaxis protein